MWTPSFWRGVVIVALLILASIGGVSLTLWLQQPETFPIRHVQVEGNLHFLDRVRLEREISPYVTGGFFNVDVVRVHNILLQNPWVQHLSIKRVWPDKLYIKVIERTPVVRWNQQHLIDEQGELFSPKGMTRFSHLPVLTGPVDQANVLFQEWVYIDKLLKKMGLAVARVSMSQRHAYDIELRDGFLIRLGTEDTHRRLERFVELFPKVQRHAGKHLRYADLRYTNGMAIGTN